MFRPRMHPSCFQAIFLSEDCIGNSELVLRAVLKQKAPIVITLTNAVPTNDFFQTTETLQHYLAGVLLSCLRRYE